MTVMKYKHFCLLLILGISQVSCLGLAGLGDSLQDSKYTVSGTITSGDNNNIKIAKAELNVRLVPSDKAERQLTPPRVYMEEGVFYYSFSDVPAGKYNLSFESQYHKDAVYPVEVKDNTVLNVVLEPLMSVECKTDTLIFASRENSKSLLIKNLTNSRIRFTIKAERSDPNASQTVYFKMPSDLFPFGNSLQSYLEPGEERSLVIDIERREETGIYSGSFKVSCPDVLEYFIVPFTVVTTDRDYYSNVCGTITDTNGNPIEGVLLRAYVEGGTSVCYTNTDSDGKYNIERVYSGFIDVWPTKWEKQTKYLTISGSGKEYVCDFSLAPLSRYILTDKKRFDFGTISTGKSYSMDIKLSCSDGGKGGFITRSFSDFVNFNPRSATFSIGQGWYPCTMTLTLDPGNATPGEHIIYVYICTDDAGILQLPVTFFVE